MARQRAPSRSPPNGRPPARCHRSLSSRTGRSTPRPHHSSATTPCSNSCRSASCISRARESRTTSPTRRSDSASPFGGSAAHERRLAACLHCPGGFASPQLRLVSIPYQDLRRGGGGRRDRYIHAHGATTTLALRLLLNTVGIGFFCWLARFAVFCLMWPAA